MSTAELPGDTGILDEPDWGNPENACVNYERCGNIVPYNGEVCADCLDEGVDNE